MSGPERVFPPGGYVERGGAWIHPNARIASDVDIEPGAVVGSDVVIGPSTWIGAGAIVYGPTTMGEGNQIHSGAVIGGAPQDIGYRGEPTRLEIGDRNVFREHVTVHRGTVKGGGVTRVGSDNYFMAETHIGHDSVVGDHIIFTNACLIAGHCHVQDRVYMGGRVSIVQFTTVGRNSFITGLSGTTMDVEPFLSHTGVPARPRSVNVVGLRRSGFPNASIKALMEAYKILFTHSSKGGDNLDQVERELSERGAICAEVSELLDFIRRSRAGRHGRMLQGNGAASIAEPSSESDDPSGYAQRWTEKKGDRGEQED